MMPVPQPRGKQKVIRDAIFLGMNSQWARDKAIDLMNEEGKELTVEFLMNQLAVEDCNALHKSQGQNNSGAHRSSNHSHQSRKPPGMEGKCMRCGMSQNRTLPQVMPVQDKRQGSQSCPDTTPG